MNILVVGAHFYNKGAHLMMAAVRAHFEGRKDVNLYLSPCAGTPEQIDDVGYSRLDFPLKHVTAYRSFDVFFTFGKIIRLLRKSYRGELPLSKIDAVLDIAGFAYSDQWGDKSVVNVTKLIRKIKRNKGDYIFLSQAFGPFTGNVIRQGMNEAIQLSDMVIARDKDSLNMLQEISNNPKICQYPDITIGLETKPIPLDKEHSYSCVVANERMLDQGKEYWPEGKYMEYLIKAVEAILSNTTDVVYLVIHDNGRGDVDLSNEVKSKFSSDERVQVFFEADPIKLKGYLGAANMLVASRFHALVSALSQNVPCISLGWSHKYNMLFEEYGIPELTFEKPKDEAYAYELNRFWEPERLNQICTAVRTSNESLKEANIEMWDKVESLLHKK